MTSSTTEPFSTSDSLSSN